MSDELWRSSATELAAAIRRREVSCVEVMEAHLARIEAVNPLLNAIVTLDAELGPARGARRPTPPSGATRRPGRCTACRSPSRTSRTPRACGRPTARRSTATTSRPPTRCIVARLRRAGAIVIGKTNTPEFGAGSQTFNPVFGATRNPYDLHAHAGRQQRRRGGRGGERHGPVRRRVGSRREHPQPRLLLQPRRAAHRAGPRAGGAVAGRVEPDGGARAAGAQRRGRRPAAAGHGRPRSRARRCRSTIRRTPSCSAPDLDPRGARIAWSRNLGDLPVEPAVTAVLEDHRAALEAMGCVVEDVEPDLTAADDAFEVLRGVGFAQAFGPMLETDGDQLKETIRWNTRVGLALTGADVAPGARRCRPRCTSACARCSSATTRWRCRSARWRRSPSSRSGSPRSRAPPMGSYLEWMRSCSRITVTAHPALSLPAGFTPDGLPVGAAARRPPARRARPPAPGRGHRAGHRGRAPRARAVSRGV